MGEWLRIYGMGVLVWGLAVLGSLLAWLVLIWAVSRGIR